MSESIRVLLIRWNVAPLSIVIFLCAVTYKMINVLLSMTCESNSGIYVALSGLIATMGGIIYKLYDSMQKDRDPQP